MKICIFEDSFISGLFPVNVLRHSSQIICGVYNLKEKIEHILENAYEIILHCRKHLAPYCKETFPGLKINYLTKDDYIFLNSRVIFPKSFVEGLLLTFNEMKNSMILHGKEIVAFQVSKDKLSMLNKIINSGELISIKTLSNFKFKQIQLSNLDSDSTEEIKIISSAADLINYHEHEIRKDLDFLFKNKKLNYKKEVKAELLNPSKIMIEQNCNINKNTVLDATKGEIYISKNTTIEPFSYIAGPVFVGEMTTIRSGSKLYGPLYIGKNCKISGELVSSIINSYVNKQHLGFIGHSYICEWVNLGAGTTTSNLKNNYSNITLTVQSKRIDSRSIFLGSIIGDHTKTGISTMLNTGTVIGISSNLFGCGYHSKFIESFSWVNSSGEIKLYELEKALQTAMISMRRRNIVMTNEYKNLFMFYYKNAKRNIS